MHYYYSIQPNVDASKEAFAVLIQSHASSISKRAE
jgi:hypothetical protein